MNERGNLVEKDNKRRHRSVIKFRNGKTYKSSRRKSSIFQITAIISTALVFGIFSSPIGQSALQEDFLATLLMITLLSVLALPISMGLIVVLFIVFHPDRFYGITIDYVENAYYEGHMSVQDQDSN